MTTTKPPLEAWTLRALSDALGADPEIVERVLDANVADGRAVRLSQGEHSFFIPGQLSAVLTDLGAEPVQGARVREVRESVLQRKVRKAARETRARRRAREINDEDKP